MSQVEGELTEGHVPMEAQATEYTDLGASTEHWGWAKAYVDPLFGEAWKEKSQEVKSEPEEVPGVEETDMLSESWAESGMSGIL